MDSGIAIKIIENKTESRLLSKLLVTTIGFSVAIQIILWGSTWLLRDTVSQKFSISFNFINGLFLYTILYQYNYNIYNFMRWLGNAKQAALINFLSSALSISFGLVLILMNPKLESYIIGSICGSFIGAAISTYYGRKYLSLRVLSYSQFKDLMVLSVPYVPTYLSNYLLQFIDRLIITASFGFEILGLYALINRIGTVALFALQIISNGFRPVIFSNYQNVEGQSLGRKIFSFFWSSLIPVTVLVIMLSKPVINIFGGDQYGEGASILPYSLISVMFWSTFFLFGFGYQIRRKTVYITLITLAVVGLVYLLSFPLIKVSGIVGVAQATFLSTMIGSFLYIYVSERLYAFGYNLKLMVASMITCSAILFFINDLVH